MTWEDTFQPRRICSTAMPVFEVTTETGFGLADHAERWGVYCQIAREHGGHLYVVTNYGSFPVAQYIPSAREHASVHGIGDYQPGLAKPRYFVLNDGEHARA